MGETGSPTLEGGFTGFSRHAFARGVAPVAFPSGVAGADADPDFLPAWEAAEVEAAFFAGVGVLPVGAGRVGIGGGVLDLVVFDDAGLAVALAGELAVVVAHGQFEAGGLVGDGLRRGRAFHTHEGGLHVGHGGGDFADFGGQGDGVVRDGFLRCVPFLGGQGDLVFSRAQFGLPGFQAVHLGMQGGDSSREAGKDLLLGGGGEDGTDAGDQRWHREVLQINDDVKHGCGWLRVQDLLIGPRIIISH